MPKAFSCEKPGDVLKEVSFELGELGADEVDVRIVASGVCASDVVLLKGAVPGLPFPMVAGHEGVGNVEKVGSSVRTVKEGDAVGLGVYRDSCEGCRACVAGRINHCAKKRLMFMMGDRGTFAGVVRIKAKFAVPLPADLSLAHAGPLMCAGATAYGALKASALEPASHIAVVGLGGVGHLAVQLAVALGHKVHVISRSKDKEAEAIKFGAAGIITFAELPKDTFDSVLVCAAAPQGSLDWCALASSMVPGGALVLVGITRDQLPFVDVELITKALRVVGVASGSLDDLATVLRLCASHSILPTCQFFAPERINEAIDHVHTGKARYRAVVLFDPDLRAGHDLM